jgi:hypothetical protein
MTAFLYFAAGVSKPVTVEDLPGLGLAHAFESNPQSSPLSGRTPTGGPGMLIWNQARIGDHMPAYVPEKQTWRTVPGRPEVQVGFYTDAPPTPATLRKVGGMAGQKLTLGDGHNWIAPVLAMFGGEGGFSPAYSLVADLDEEGRWITGGPTASSRAIQALFDRLYVGMSSETGIDAATGLDAAAELLGINYVVSRVELAQLRVLTTDETLIKILNVALDWDHVLEWSKKKIEELSPPVSAG